VGEVETPASPSPPLRYKIDSTIQSKKRPEMFPSKPCSICSEAGHSPLKCPELSSETKQPDAPQPTGPRGQDDDDE